MQRVIFISKVPISNFPRLMSIPFALTNLGHPVTIFAPGNLPEIFCDNDNIQFKELNFKKREGNLMTKFVTWINYRLEVINKLDNYSKDYLIWLSSADTAIPLLGKIKQRKIILQINELYDANFAYRFILKKIANFAKSIVVPEYNRANIFRVWFKLNQLPFVLPNKSIIPDFDSTGFGNLQIIDDINHLKSNGYKIFIYQGHIGKDRDFTSLVEILKEIPLKIHLLLVGTDYGMVEKYKKIFSCITWVSHIKAPGHLALTKIADVGIIYYNPDSLNNVFCAPNKIWEYSKYGLPIISNDIPGMFETTHFYKAGISCDFTSKVELLNTVNELIENHGKFSSNSKIMYEQLDYQSEIQKIIDGSID